MRMIFSHDTHVRYLRYLLKEEKCVPKFQTLYDFVYFVNIRLSMYDTIFRTISSENFDD